MNLKVYVACHKKVDLKIPNCYELVQVGSSINQPLGYTRDDAGENISTRNPNYCELTLLYWMWKNRPSQAWYRCRCCSR